jgi:pimeloyl-ACP methyl ester carboxylesterase
MSVNPYPGPMAPWPALAPYGRLVTPANGRRLFVYEAGAASAPALVLVHGLGDEADTWRHIFEPLAERWHVIALDLPGFGRSDAARRYRLPVLRDALLSLLDELGLESAILMGSSLGAMLAQMAALKAPERVASLILVDGALVVSGGKPSWAMLRMALPIVGRRIYTGYRRNPRAAYDSLRPFYANLDGLPPEDRQFLFQRVNERVWSDTQMHAYLGLYGDLVWSAPRRQRLLAALAQSSTPLHLIWGERDTIMPVSMAQPVRDAQPAAPLTIIPGAGHLPHQERPQAFVEAVLAALSQPAQANQDAADALTA